MAIVNVDSANAVIHNAVLYSCVFVLLFHGWLLNSVLSNLRSYVAYALLYDYIETLTGCVMFFFSTGSLRFPSCGFELFPVVSVSAPLVVH